MSTSPFHRPFFWSPISFSSRLVLDHIVFVWCLVLSRDAWNDLHVPQAAIIGHEAPTSEGEAVLSWKNACCLHSDSLEVDGMVPWKTTFLYEQGVNSLGVSPTQGRVGTSGRVGWTELRGTAQWSARYAMWSEGDVVHPWRWFVNHTG